MKTVSQQALQTIEARHIKALPKWRFALKRWLLGALTLICLLLGSLSFALIHYSIQNQDWDLYRTSSSWPKLAWLAIPYAWVAVFALFVFLVYYNFKQSKRGYAYAPLLVVVLCVCLSTAFGALASGSGIAGKLQAAFSKNISFYPAVFDPKTKIWQEPANGLLAGKVVKVQDKQITVRDANKKEWTIAFTAPDATDKTGANNLRVGEDVKMSGRQAGDHSFTATALRDTKKRLQAPVRQKPPAKADFLQKLRNLKNDFLKNKHKAQKK